MKKTKKSCNHLFLNSYNYPSDFVTEGHLYAQPAFWRKQAGFCLKKSKKS